MRALSALGCSWEIDQAAFEKGRLLVRVQVPYERESLDLEAHYPGSYPYFQPQVRLLNRRLNRHQNPLQKHLCLLAREGEEWCPGIETLGQLLQQQLPTLLALQDDGASPEFVAEYEDHAAEPLSSYLPYLPGSAIAVPDQTPAKEIKAGRLRLQIRPTQGAHDDNQPPVVGMVESVDDISRNALVGLSIRPAMFTKLVEGFWFRLEKRPSWTDEKDLRLALVGEMKERHPEFRKALISGKKGQSMIAGFDYSDETSWHGSGDDWFFLKIEFTVSKKGSREAQSKISYVRADWAGEDSWLRRAPTLRPLREKSVLLIGLGSLGSTVALQLAKAGIRVLHLIDCDIFQIGNSIRWARGWTSFAQSKSEILHHAIQADYPYTEVHRYDIRIGVPLFSDDGLSDYDFVRARCENVDLVIDATASHRVSHFVADLCQEIGKPFLWLTTTHGAAGGVVGRIIPGTTAGCWHCVQRGLGDGSIKLPADSGAPEIEPGGCSQPTFIGAGVDSDEIALTATRLAIATLCRNDADRYADFKWDVAVADLQRDGYSVAPEWTVYAGDKHPDCEPCNHS